MPNITMLDIEDLRKTKLRPYIDKCVQHRAPDPGFHAMMGHNIDLCEAMFVAWDTIFNTGRVSHKLKEIIRVQLSRMASCVYWGNVRSASAKRQGLTEGDIDEGIADYAASPRFTEAEKLALRYSELMALNPAKIGPEFYDQLRRHYSEEEIVELGAFIGFNIGYHTFFGTLKFYPMFSPDGRLVSQDESARIYGVAPSSLSGATKWRGFTTVPHVEPLSPAEIRDPELLELIRRCEVLGVPDTLFPRILARVPAHAKALLRALLVSHTGGNVDHRLKEIIRVRLARIAGDPYFGGLRSAQAMQAGLDEDRIEAGSGKFEEDPRFTAAEKWALRYAREMYLNPEKIDAAFYDEGKRHYTEAQIMELGAFIAFHYGMQAFTRTLGARPLPRDEG